MKDKYLRFSVVFVAVCIGIYFIVKAIAYLRFYRSVGEALDLFSPLIEQLQKM